MININKKTVLFRFIFKYLLVSTNYNSGFGMLAKDLKAVLPSGDSFPMIGFGTSRILGTEVVKNTLDQALAAGYRLFDTAQIYGNEEDIGKALKELLPKHNLTRKDVFITSKVPARDYALGKKAYGTLEKSLKNMNLEYLDLYLIHFPGIPETETGLKNVNYSQLRDETWEQLAKGVKNNLVRNIGVSNYNVRHLKELVNNDHGIKVSVNQVEWHPLYHQDVLQEFCKNNGIVLQAYFSLGGSSSSDLFNNPEVKKVAEKLGKSIAQVLLRWSVQQNVAVIPKSLNRKHMESNLDLNFEIPEPDLKILNNLPQREKVGRWNPDDIL